MHSKESLQPFRPSRRQRQTAILALLGIAGSFMACNFAPDYVRPEAPVPESFKEQTAPEPQLKEASPKDSEARGNWWEIYHDETLNRLEETVSISNNTVTAAYYNYEQARALVTEARSQYFPALSLGGSAQNAQASGSLPNTTTSGGNGVAKTLYTAQGDISYEPDFWGKIRNTVAQKEHEAEASAADLETTRLAVQSELALDYFQIHMLDSQQTLLDTTVSGYQKSLDLVRSRFRGGVASAEDVAQAETQLQTASVQAQDLHYQRAVVEHAIAVLLGKAASDFSIEVQPLTADIPEIPAGIPSELLERRPDVAAAERRVAEANAGIGIARAAFFPDLTISASGGFQALTLDKWLQWASRFYNLDASFSQPLLDWGKRSAEVDRTKAVYGQEVAAYRQRVLTAFQEVEDNLAALRVLAGEAKDQDGAVAAAQRTLKLSQDRYKYGVVAYLDVITAQNSALATQVSALTIYNRRMAASVNLLKALGGSWEPPAKP